MSSTPEPHIQKIIFQGINLTDDGLGVFDDKDYLVYCNEKLANLYGLNADKALNQHFSDLIRHCYQAPSGVNIETDDVEDWIIQANKKRRSKDYRAFETDAKDGRWFLVTEQLVEQQYIFMFCSDITEKKQYEFKIKRASEELFKLASVDSLTGLYTRHHFYQQAEREFERCQRNPLPLSLLMIDLDHFKQINDQYGHGGGDEVLRSFAENAQEQLRGYDLIGRLGGEEFAVLLPDTNSHQTKAIAERIRETSASLHINYQKQRIHVTASIGIAVASPQDSTLDSLIQRADKLLYKAKQLGRNRIHD